MISVITAYLIIKYAPDGFLDLFKLDDEEEERIMLQ